MQEIVTKLERANSLDFEDLPPEDRQRLVDAFAWLIQEDKKQNPDLYQPKKNYD
jgi:hypothetical protein